MICYECLIKLQRWIERDVYYVKREEHPSSSVEPRLHKRQRRHNSFARFVSNLNFKFCAFLVPSGLDVTHGNVLAQCRRRDARSDGAYLSIQLPRRKERGAGALTYPMARFVMEQGSLHLLYVEYSRTISIFFRTGLTKIRTSSRCTFHDHADASTRRAVLEVVEHPFVSDEPTCLPPFFTCRDHCELSDSIEMC